MTYDRCMISGSRRTWFSALAGVVAFFAATAFFLDTVTGAGQIFVSRIDRGGVERLMKEKNSSMVIVMMASWCGPCRKELPSLIRLQKRYRHQRIKMVGISFEVNDVSAIQILLDKERVNFPVYSAGEEILRIYKISAIPTLFLVKDGGILERIVGLRSEKFLEQKIIHMLK